MYGKAVECYGDAALAVQAICFMLSSGTALLLMKSDKKTVTSYGVAFTALNRDNAKKVLWLISQIAVEAEGSQWASIGGLRQARLLANDYPLVAWHCIHNFVAGTTIQEPVSSVLWIIVIQCVLLILYGIYLWVRGLNIPKSHMEAEKMQIL